MSQSQPAGRRRDGGALRSLQLYNYRLWAVGAAISNIGTWMQRTAQDWLVLTQLTNRSASSLGIVMALQFGPQLIFLPWIGFAADYFERRKLLMVTQALMGSMALILGALTVTGLIALWHVYVIAFVSGTVSAFDAPARQTFVADLVGDRDLANAVALNSTSFNSARMIGPAVSGLCIAAWGTGWAFLINGTSFIGVLLSLFFLRKSEIHPAPRLAGRRGSLIEGLRYVQRRADLRALMIMLFLIGTFGLNFPIFLSTMSVTVFHVGAGRYGLLTSIMALGTIAATIAAARRERPRYELLVASGWLFGIGFVCAAIMPSYWLFGAALVIVGMASLTFTNSSVSLMQLSSEPVMRGRLMALRLAIMSGSTPFGAPLVGWVADRFGARWGLALGAAGGLLAGLVGLVYLIRHRQLRLRIVGQRPRLSLDPASDPMLLVRKPSEIVIVETSPADEEEKN